MSTDLQRVNAALQEPAVTNALSWESMLDSYDPATMTLDDQESLADAMKKIQLATSYLEDEQKRLTAPFTLGLQQIRDKFRPALDGLRRARKKADDILRGAKRAAEQRLRQEQAEAERKAREAAEKAKAEGIDRPPMRALVRQMPSHMAARSNIVRGRSGDVVGHKTIKWKITNMREFAQAYPHAVQEITSTVRLEIRAARERDPDAKLPGIEWWLEDDFSVR